MIKGVNKRIIEINNTDSLYFEKAIFYLKPSVRELPAAVTEREVNRFISQLGLESCVTAKKGRHAGKIVLLLISLAAVAGIAVTFIV